MRVALQQAHQAGARGEVPVGAVVVHAGELLVAAGNRTEEQQDPTAHAEMICIREASQLIGWRNLRAACLYVTLEPCVMCVGALLQARVGEVVHGAPNLLLGGDGSWVSLLNVGEEGEGTRGNNESPVASPRCSHPFQPRVNVRRGVLKEECKEILITFFRERRRYKANENKRKKIMEDPPNMKT